MERVNAHYDPAGGMIPTPADHMIHHARSLGVADKPPADHPGDDARRWSMDECLAATSYCAAYLAENPDSYPPVAPPRPQRPYGYRLRLSTAHAFHDA